MAQEEGVTQYDTYVNGDDLNLMNVVVKSHQPAPYVRDQPPLPPAQQGICPGTEEQPIVVGVAESISEQPNSDTHNYYQRADHSDISVGHQAEQQPIISGVAESISEQINSDTQNYQDANHVDISGGYLNDIYGASGGQRELSISAVQETPNVVVPPNNTVGQPSIDFVIEMNHSRKICSTSISNGHGTAATDISSGP